MITSFIQETVDKYSPSKTSRSELPSLGLYLRLEEKIPKSNKTHKKKAKKTGSSKLKSNFQELRQKIKANIKKQHDLYVNKLVGDVKVKSKDFYQYTNRQRKHNQGIPPLKRSNGSGLR